MKRETLLHGMHVGRHNEFADRIVETHQKVCRHNTIADRLRAALDLLEEDTRALIEGGDKASQIASVDAFRLNREQWIEMVIHGANSDED